MALRDNSPTLSYIKADGISVDFNGSLYTVSDFYTNKKYIYWNYSHPNQFFASNTMPDRSNSQFLVLVNDNGAAVEVPNENIIVKYDGNSLEAVRERIYGIYEENEEFGNRFVSIEENIDGIKHMVGDSSNPEEGTIIDRISKVEQRADGIDLEVKKTTKDFGDDKTLRELRDNLNKSIIELNSNLGVFKSDMDSFSRDNSVSADEKNAIAVHINSLTEKKNIMFSYIDIVLDMCEDKSIIQNGKNALDNAHSNLVNNINSAISDNIITPSDITLISSDFARYNLRVNELKNSCDEVVFLGANGRLLEEVAGISIKSNEIKMSVSTIEGDYVRNSQLTQLDDKFEFKFENYGKPNLIPNSNPTVSNYNGWVASGSEAFIYTWNPGQVNIGIASKNTSGEVYAFSKEIKVKPNTKYSIKFKIQKEYKVESCEAHIIGSRDENYNYDWTPSLTGKITDTEWHTICQTITTPSDINYIKFRIDNDKCLDISGGFVVWFQEFMLIEGENIYPSVWYPADNEVFNNITSITKDGITVSMNNGNGNQGYSKVDYEGLGIYNASGQRKAWFGDNDSAYIDTITTNDIRNPYVLQNGTTRGRPSNFYINPTPTGDGTGRDVNNYSSSINHTLNWIRTNYGCYSWQQDINIYVNNGTYNEDIYVGGWLGVGNINIQFDNYATWYGEHTFEECTMGIQFCGRRWNYGQWINEGCVFVKRGWREGLFTIRACKSIEILDLRAVKEGWYGTGNEWWGYGNSFVNATKGSKVYVNQCDWVGFYWGVVAYHNCDVTIYDCRGHNYRTGSVGVGSTCKFGGAVPIYNGGFDLPSCGSWENYSHSGHNSAFQPRDTYVPPDPPEPPVDPPPPPPPPDKVWTWFEQSFGLYNLRTVPEGSGSATSSRNGEWGQGRWDSYKPHRGYADMGDNPVSWCSGGRNFSAWLTVTRSSSSHGIAGATPRPRIKLPDGSFWDCGVGIARGQTVTFELPSSLAGSIAGGNIKTLEMWAGTSTNDYSFYNSSSIKIKCEKEV